MSKVRISFRNSKKHDAQYERVILDRTSTRGETKVLNQSDGSLVAIHMNAGIEQIAIAEDESEAYQALRGTMAAMTEGELSVLSDLCDAAGTLNADQSSKLRGLLRELREETLTALIPVRPTSD
jgi:hypothetical protein